MENMEEMYNDGFQDNVEEEAVREEKKPTDPYVLIIAVQSVILILALLSLLVVKMSFPKAFEIAEKFYNENVKTETSVELVLSDKES